MCFKILLKYKYTYMYRVYKVLTLVNQLLYNIGLFSPTCLSILGKCFKATVSIFSSVHILSSSRTKLQSHDHHMTITTPTHRSWKSRSASWAQTRVLQLRDSRGVSNLRRSHGPSESFHEDCICNETTYPL